MNAALKIALTALGSLIFAVGVMVAFAAPVWTGPYVQNRPDKGYILIAFKGSGGERQLYAKFINAKGRAQARAVMDAVEHQRRLPVPILFNPSTAIWDQCDTKLMFGTPAEIQALCPP